MDELKGHPIALDKIQCYDSIIVLSQPMNSKQNNKYITDLTSVFLKLLSLSRVAM